MPCSYRVNMYLCSRIGSDLSGRASGLKGNRVKVPDSPAAVKLHIQLFGKHSCHWRKEAPGRFRKGSQSEDLPSFKPARSPGIGRAADRLSTTKKDIADIAERRAQSPCMYATSARTLWSTDFFYRNLYKSYENEKESHAAPLEHRPLRHLYRHFVQR